MARTFDNETGERIQIGTAGFTNGDNCYVGGWIYITSISGGVDHRFIAKATGTSPAAHTWMLGTTGNTLRARWQDSSTTVTTIVGATNLTVAHLNKWIFVLTEFQNAANIRIMLDGTQDVTNALNRKVLTETSTQSVIGNSHDNASATSSPNGHMAWWFTAKRSSILTADEHTALARGVPPWRIFRGQSDLIHCFPLWGDHAPEINLVQGGTSGTIQGTIPRHHGGPPILFPYRWRMPPFLEEVAAAGGLSIPVAMHSYRQRRIA